jgi:hypothetical protein
MPHQCRTPSAHALFTALPGGPRARLSTPQGKRAAPTRRMWWRPAEELRRPGPRLADGDAGAPRPHRVRQLARAKAAGRPERPAAQAREARAQLERQQRAARAQAVPRQHQPPALRPSCAASALAASARLCPISTSRHPCARPRPLPVAPMGNGGAGDDAGDPGARRPAAPTGHA